jgi:hypothetical protein
MSDPVVVGRRNVVVGSGRGCEYEHIADTQYWCVIQAVILEKIRVAEICTLIAFLM